MERNPSQAAGTRAERLGSNISNRVDTRKTQPGGEPSIILNSDSQVASSQSASRKIDRKHGPRSLVLLLKLLNFSCSQCSFPDDHSDHFLVNINRRESARHAAAARAGDGLLLEA